MDFYLRLSFNKLLMVQMVKIVICSLHVYGLTNHLGKNLYSMSNSPVGYILSQFHILENAHLPTKTQIYQNNGNKETSSEALMLKGFVRGHKCLLDDSNINNGNIVYLLRGADASQRLLYPLELKTNAPFLKGYSTALKMFENSKEAIEFATQKIFNNFQSIDISSFEADILKEDMPRYHRILQYSIAAGLSQSFLRKEALKYNIELYEEMEINKDALTFGIASFRDFYQNKITDEEMQNNFLPSWNILIQEIINLKFMESPSGELPQPKKPLIFEPPPEKGTISDFIVDIKNLKLDDFPEDSKKEMQEFLIKLSNEKA